LKGAWFQPLDLSSEKLVSTFACKCNLYRYTLAFQSGSGNNWARGYNTYGTQVREAALELVRRETEACDHMVGLALFTT
jgi:hypothetical protein